MACHADYVLWHMHMRSARVQVQPLSLERVSGLSPANACTVSHSPIDPSLLAYAAGAHAVIYDSAMRQQTRALASGGGRTLLCVAFSPDGACLVAGEKGQAPAVLVWEVSSGRMVHEMRGHKHGVARLSFSYDGELGACKGSKTARAGT